VKLSGRIVVEPLDEERLTNIERRVVSGAVDAAARGLRAPRRIAGRVVAVAAVVAAGLAGWALHAPPRGAVVAEPAAIRIETSPGHATLDIGDARIASEPDTVFAVTRPGGGVLVAMTRGKVELAVGARDGRPPLIVRAGETEVIVVGTRFTVDYGDGRGDVDVRVTEGVVRVVHQQQETRVAAGNAWHTRRGLIAGAAGGLGDGGAKRGSDDAPVGAGPVASHEPARAVGAGSLGTGVAAGHAPSQAVDPAVDGAMRTSGGPTGGTVPTRAGVVIATGPAPAVLHDRTAAVPDGRARTPATVRTAPSRPGSVTDAAKRPTARPGDPHVDLRTAIRRQRVEPALDLAEPNATSAVARYYDIAAHQSGDAASQAFYSIAVVRHLRLGQHTEALQTLDAYVRRFPGGKEYRAALWLRVRILCLDKLDDRCRAAAYTFVHEAPDAPAARTAELITLGE
jgi:hypothetical protein